MGFNGRARLRQDVAAQPGGTETSDLLAELDVYLTGTAGSAGADIYLGDAADVNYRGGGGIDDLFGEAGNDILLGEAGNDTYLFGRVMARTPSTAHRTVR